MTRKEASWAPTSYWRPILAHDVSLIECLLIRNDYQGQKVQDIGDPTVVFCVYDTLCHILKNEGVSDGKGTQKKGY